MAWFHLVKMSPRRNFDILIGAHHLGWIRDNPSVQILEPKRVIIHEEFDPDHLANDIALVELDGRAKMSDAVALACLGNPLGAASLRPQVKMRI